jgi:hypothetical protein
MSSLRIPEFYSGSIKLVTHIWLYGRIVRHVPRLDESLTWCRSNRILSRRNSMANSSG